MKKLDRLIAISKLSKVNKKWKHKDIFRCLNKEELWVIAYENIKSNKGALTKGSNNETLDGTSMERLERLKNKVYSEQYKFNEVKLVYIPRPDGRKRPLGLPTANDKIVQEVIRIILEAIYEPTFSNCSFGFRKGYGCHDALEYVERKFRWVDYVIEGDIQRAYPTINHNRLVNILEKRIEDPRFIRLIRKLLKCGVLDNQQIIRSDTGVPQGSIVSPILANIYYHELDEFVEELKIRYETPANEINNLKSPEYKKLEHEISKIHKQMQHCEKHSQEYNDLKKHLKAIRSKRSETDSLRDKKIRIEYVRYADDWMVGISGDKNLAIKIKDKIDEFLKDKLLQELHPTKTKITDIRVGNAEFLGYEIFLPRHRPLAVYKGKGARTIRRGQRELRFDVPVAKVTNRYVERGYLKKLKTKVRPISRANYTVLEDHVIVSHYRSVWQGIEQYYSGCTNLGRLQYIHYLLHMSCAMTLGHRHRLSVTKVFKKYKKELCVKIPAKEGEDKFINFPYRTNWSKDNRKWSRGLKVPFPSDYYKNTVSRSSIGLPCAICNSERQPIEMHHVKHVRKNGYRYKGFHQQMALLNRKQIPLCKSCHQRVHAGLYDGPSLETLRKTMQKNEMGNK